MGIKLSHFVIEKPVFMMKNEFIGSVGTSRFPGFINPDSTDHASQGWIHTSMWNSLDRFSLHAWSILCKACATCRSVFKKGAMCKKETDTVTKRDTLIGSKFYNAAELASTINSITQKNTHFSLLRGEVGVLARQLH
jgi:hypothetical protein